MGLVSRFRENGAVTLVSAAVVNLWRDGQLDIAMFRQELSCSLKVFPLSWSSSATRRRRETQTMMKTRMKTKTATLKLTMSPIPR